MFLYTVRKRYWSWGDEQVVAQELASGERTTLVRHGADARYRPSGHLVFLRMGTVFAVPFDARTLTTHGEPVALLSGVVQALGAWHSGDNTGAGQVSLAPTGHLAWLPGQVSSFSEGRLVAVDRVGRINPLAAPARSFGPWVRLSPEGRRLAVEIKELHEAGLWVHDVSRGVLTKVTSGGDATAPVWSPDGQRLLFEWVAGAGHQIGWQGSAGGAAVQTLGSSEGTAGLFTPDGHGLLVVAGAGSPDIVIVGVDQGQKPQPLVQTPATDGWPAVSPDGRWLAYASDTSGRVEVYVQPYPGPGPRLQVSADGGSSPAWHPGGRELFFLGPVASDQSRMMVAAVDTAGGLRLGPPRPLFEFRASDLRFHCGPLRCYDVSLDGQRFYTVQAVPSPPVPLVTEINLVLNWVEELKAKVPSGQAK